ncbi:hypothetical protein G647_10292 [Cladophialophora carrionii CBS 160.54]|uniref:Uncharacterized protein n=1 Tax=Cladophialophora carrionii CBS 160.54 TaxID=1279043 RepID=V9DJF1_9EURO|nr:uncharacterized protein G647_10292 [Cladophialophora carrionii CBS 160.54]ETI26846.1 hypothetical protein G647_10292 [Cladophialophora carrionii CBS 160.54]
MSLVTDEVLLRLWLQAQEKGSRENVSVKFWLHFYCKYVFPGKVWVVSAENEPSVLEPSLRTDLKVEYLGDVLLELLHHHELKRSDASNSDIETVEHQAYGNSISYLAAHPEISRIYAVTSFGTKARIWTCIPDAHIISNLCSDLQLLQTGRNTSKCTLRRQQSYEKDMTI